MLLFDVVSYHHLNPIAEYLIKLSMEIILYSRLSTRSKRALLKTKKSFGKTYYYSPRGNLLQRLSQETGMSPEQVASQLVKERDYLLSLSD